MGLFHDGSARFRLLETWIYSFMSLFFSFLIISPTHYRSKLDLAGLMHFQ